MDCSPRISRRVFAEQTGVGLRSLAIAAMLASDSTLRGSSEVQPHQWASKQVTAKRVIWLFMHGGPSHVDLLDPKPQLTRFAGQRLPDSFGTFRTRRKVAQNPLLAPVKPFRPRGQSGIEISDFLPEISRHADDLCVIRSLHGDSVNHPQSVYQMNTGSVLMGRPSVGSWVSYGLGTENEDLPAFVVLLDPGGGLKGGPPAWGNGFLPAKNQGVTMRSGARPILSLAPPDGFSPEQQLDALELSNYLNQHYLESRDRDDELNARIAAYELAFRMQSTAPQLTDLSQETAETLALYGLDQPQTQEFGTRCLLARRMIEQGVRFVQIYSGNTNGWDAHSDLAANHGQLCAATDTPVAGLLTDLKRRGLWNETLVIWGGEFGRMPMSESRTGRDHNPWGYSAWLAGGAVKGGITFGATDEIGLRAVDQKVHVRDFHATLLEILGVDPLALSFYHNGLDERLVGPSDDVRVVREIFA